MATANHAKFVTTAQRLITKHGRSVTLIEFAGSDNTEEPWKGPDDPRPDVARRLTVSAVFIPPSGVSDLGHTEISQDLFKDSEQVMMFSAGAQIEVGGFDEVEDGETRWKIDTIQTLRPGTVSIISYAGLSR